MSKTRLQPLKIEEYLSVFLPLNGQSMQGLIGRMKLAMMDGKQLPAE
jgi:hypothetical protein